MLALLVKFHNWADLNRATRSRRNSGSHLDGLVEILAIEQIIAAQLLLGLSERTIGGQGLAIAYTHRRGRACIIERLTGLEDAAPLNKSAKSVKLLHDSAQFLLIHLSIDRLIFVDQQQISHGMSSSNCLFF